jgi:hypothetical protein
VPTPRPNPAEHMRRPWSPHSGIGFQRRQIQGYTTVGPAHRDVSAARYRLLVYGIPMPNVEEFNRVRACEGVTVPCSVQSFSVFPTDSATADGSAGVDMAKQRHGSGPGSVGGASQPPVAAL